MFITALLMLADMFGCNHTLMSHPPYKAAIGWPCMAITMIQVSFTKEPFNIPLSLLAVAISPDCGHVCTHFNGLQLITYLYRLLPTVLYNTS